MPHIKSVAPAFHIKMNHLLESLEWSGK